MRVDLKLHGQTSDGTFCIAETSVYIKEDNDLKNAIVGVFPTLAWFEKRPGFPDVAAGTKVALLYHERLEEKRESAPSFPDFLRKLTKGQA